MADIKKSIDTPSMNPFLTNQGVVKRVGYKTFRGCIRMLKQQNEFCRKRGVKLKFEITLPIPR